MQDFRPFSSKGHRLVGDEKRADDLDDGDGSDLSDGFNILYDSEVSDPFEQSG